MLTRHSTIAHVAYHDLLRSLADEAISDVRGTPTRVERGTRVYWYDSYRVGSEVHKTYIGEDSEELRARLGKVALLKTQRAERGRHRARLIRILRAEGLLGVDGGTGSLLAALAASGVFRLGGTIVGTAAFRLYEGELGVRLSFDDAAQTDDLDIASFERLSLALADTVSPPLQQVMADFDFEAFPSLDRTMSWRWKQARNDLLIEFLTPSFEEAEDLRPLAALGVHAQSLHYLNYLIADPIAAVVPYRSGVLVQLPRPERFAIHKLIVADRRARGTDSLKSIKDRRQSAFLIDCLAEDRPDDLREAWDAAVESGPKWRQRIAASLGMMPVSSEMLRGLGCKL